ncbi:MAG: WbqC family protein [Gallionella sp.]|nr:WbqC family protein [Gallionella sp.]
MIFSIHQPCYFPWLGLLHKIACSEVLIVLDDVQLSDSAFQHRNQFLTNDGKVKYLTIPFVKQNYLEIPFKDLQIADPTWGTKHNNFLLNNYKKHPFFDQIYPVIQPMFQKQTTFLLDVVMESMSTSMALFGIGTKVIMQSQTNYDREAKKADLVLQLLKATNAKHYLSGKGAQAYQDDAIFESEGIALEYVNFSHPVYAQKNSREFISGLSCLDLLFNVGTKQAIQVLKSGADQ